MYRTSPALRYNDLVVDDSDIPVYVPRGDPEFAQAVARAFPAHRIAVDSKLGKEQIHIGDGPVLAAHQHQIRRPTS
jgi:hypothetical protein